MKKIIIPVAAIVLIGVVGPKFTGNGINEGLDNFVSILDKSPGYIATIESRETNWFSTTVWPKLLSASMKGYART